MGWRRFSFTLTSQSSLYCRRRSPEREPFLSRHKLRSTLRLAQLWLRFGLVAGFIVVVGGIVLLILGDPSSAFMAFLGAALILSGSEYGRRFVNRIANLS